MQLPTYEEAFILLRALDKYQGTLPRVTTEDRDFLEKFANAAGRLVDMMESPVERELLIDAFEWGRHENDLEGKAS